MATDKMRVRLYWQDGRVEQLKGEVDAGTTHIVRQTPEGHRHFDFAEEIDDEGYAIFWQEEEEQQWRAGRLVIDKTGLTGYYNVRLESTSAGAFATPEAAATAGDLPSVFTAVQEQLGLKLEPSRASVQVLVIDHVERPTEN